jgi:hypothetical protein
MLSKLLFADCHTLIFFSISCTSCFNSLTSFGSSSNGYSFCATNYCKPVSFMIKSRMECLSVITLCIIVSSPRTLSTHFPSITKNLEHHLEKRGVPNMGLFHLKSKKLSSSSLFSYLAIRLYNRLNLYR